jgi:hypothetical protein
VRAATCESLGTAPQRAGHDIEAGRVEWCVRAAVRRRADINVTAATTAETNRAGTNTAAATTKANPGTTGRAAIRPPAISKPTPTPSSSPRRMQP